MSDAASLIVFVLGVVLGSSVIPGLMWLGYREEAKARWPRRVVGTQVVNAAKYREAVVPTFGGERPPFNVRVAAIGAWGLGQMFLPGLALGLFGLLVVIGVVSIPGLILAWKNFFTGRTLLLGERGAEEKARSLASFTVILNVLVLAVVAVGSLWNLATATSALRALREIVALGGPVALYAAISLMHARFLRRAADEIEAHNLRLDEEALSGVRVDVDQFSAQLGSDELPAVEPATQAARGS
jgi:hypothetical protein